ncbi:MAG: hypothetical protein HUU37_00480 [Bdellovibrionales bacterium]|nr:hypothetical protein [Bdellovibrionales bacterium]
MSRLIIFLVLGVLFFLSYFLAEMVSGAQERRAARAEDPSLKLPEGAGAFRSVYAYVVCALMTALFSLLFPLALDFKNQLQAAPHGIEAWMILLRVVSIPCFMLVLLLYSGRRNALRWIKEASWPKD